MGLCGSTTAGIDEEAAIAAEANDTADQKDTPVLKARHSDSTVNSSLSGQLELKDEADSLCLLTIPFFADLDKKHLRDLRSVFTRRVFNKDDIVVAEGTAAAAGGVSTFHVVISGRVRLCARDAKDTSVPLSELTHGDWFGEMTAVQNHVQPVTAQALEDNTVILYIRSDQFSEAVKKFPDLGVSFSVQWATTQPPLKLQLKKIPFFAEVNELKLQVLGTLCTIRRLRERSVICTQGDEADGFYFIVQGRVEVTAEGGGAALSGGVAKEASRAVYLDTLHTGDWFGEIALLERTTRTATVTAVADCILLYLSRERFEAFLRLAPEVASSKFFDDLVRKRTANSLKAIPIFGLLKKKEKGPVERFDEKRLSMLGSLFRFVQYGPGDLIFQEGDPGDAFYIIVRGKCRVTAKSAHNTVAFLNELRENDWFGENSLLGSSRCTATVNATNKVMLLKLNAADFKRFLSIAPELEEVLRERISVRTADRLKKIPFFTAVRENKPWSKLDLLGGLFTFEEFDKGAIVFSEGSVGDRFYVIVSGEVQASARREGEGDVVLSHLVSNMWFGEIALMKDTTRTATLKCMTDCVLISITAEYWKRFLNIAPELVKPFQSMLDHRTANILKSLKIFKHVHENRPWNKLEMLSSMTQYITYAPNEVIYRKGDVDDKFYVMIGGKVRISDSDGKSIERDESEFFGESACFKRAARPQTATALTRVSLMYFTTAAFKRFLKMAPELRPHFEKMISERIRGIVDFEELATEYEDAGSLMMPPSETKEHQNHRFIELKLAGGGVGGAGHHMDMKSSGPMGDFKETKDDIYVDNAQRAIGAALTAAAAAAAAATTPTGSSSSAPLALSSSEVHLEIVSSSQPLMASTAASDSTNFS